MIIINIYMSLTRKTHAALLKLQELAGQITTSSIRKNTHLKDYNFTKKHLSCFAFTRLLITLYKKVRSGSTRTGTLSFLDFKVDRKENKTALQNPFNESMR